MFYKVYATSADGSKIWSHDFDASKINLASALTQAQALAAQHGFTLSVEYWSDNATALIIL